MTGFFALTSCNVTRKLAEDEYLLARNKIRIEKEADLSRTERVDRDDLTRYVRQRPNKRILGFDFFLWVHNLANPEKNNRWNNWKRRIGEEPVIYDSLQTIRTVDAMSIFLRSQGFFNSQVDFRTDTIRKRITVRYHVKQAAPYRIGQVTYEFNDRFVEPIILRDSNNTLVHPGEIFNVDVLQAERQRLTDLLKNRGFYNFSINNISYVADSVTRERVINLKTVVRQRNAGYDENDLPVLENNSVYRIREINVFPDHSHRMTEDEMAVTRFDTVEYRGVRFIYQNQMNIRPDVLSRAINIYPNNIYSQREVNRAYDNMMRLNYFRNVNILFTEETDANSNLITFIGDEDESPSNTREDYLTCNIYCAPGPRQAYTVNAEGTGTQSYYGLLLSVGYQNRNIFKGVELLDFTVTGGYEFMQTKARKNSVELGASVSLTFPRFLAPVRVDRYNRNQNVKSVVEFSIYSQNKSIYNRWVGSFSFGYSWHNNRYSSYTIRPVDVSFIKLNSIDSAFLASIPNPYLKQSYQNQLVPGISGSFTFNNQSRNSAKSTIRIRVNAETAGNLVFALSNMFDKKPEIGHYKVFGIKYAQYARADMDLSHRFPLSSKTSLVYHVYLGKASPYGNSKPGSLEQTVGEDGTVNLGEINAIPYERYFYSGGPNSMRGWQARTLGPGSSKIHADSTQSSYPQQVGDIKIEANTEFRFPVYRFLNGALFADVGNVWLSRSLSNDPDAIFEFNHFYRQLGFNTGIGARLDFGFFLFRLDWGLKIHDPNRQVGDKWIRNITMKHSTITFNVGYPF